MLLTSCLRKGDLLLSNSIISFFHTWVHQELNPIHYLPVSLIASKLMPRTFQSVTYFQKQDRTTKLTALMHHGKQSPIMKKLPNRLKIHKEQQTTPRIYALPIIFSQEQVTSHTAASQRYQVSTFHTEKRNRVTVRNGYIE